MKKRTSLILFGGVVALAILVAVIIIVLRALT
jgi:hypothetical protein